MLHYVSLRFTQKRIHQLLSTKTKSLEIAVELLPQNSTSKSPFYRSKIGVKRSKKVSKKPVVVATCWFSYFWCPGSDLNRYELFIRGILSPLRLPFRHLGRRMVPRDGLEPSTPWLKVKCSTTELTEDTWLGWLGSDQRMTESKSVALPLGYTPIKEWWAKMDLNHRTRRSWFTVSRVWPLRYSPTDFDTRWDCNGGCYRVRTCDPRLVRAMLSRWAKHPWGHPTKNVPNKYTIDLLPRQRRKKPV